MPKIDRTVTREYIMNNTPWDPSPDWLYYLPDRIFNCRDGIVEVWATETDPPTLTGTIQFPSFDITCVAAGAKPINLRWPIDPDHPNYGVTGKPQYEEDTASAGGYLYLGTEGYGIYVIPMSNIYRDQYDDFSYYWRFDTTENPLRSPYVYDVSTAPYQKYQENYCVVSDGGVDVCTFTGTEYWDPNAWDEDNEQFGLWISTIAQFYAYTETPHAYRCFQTSSGTFYYSERSFCKMDPMYINPIESTYEAESVPVEAFADFEYFRLVVLDPPTPEDNYQVRLDFKPFPFDKVDHDYVYNQRSQCYSTYIVDELGTPLYYFLSEECYTQPSYGNPLTVTVKVRYANTKKLYFLYKWPTPRTNYYFGNNDPNDVFELYDTFMPSYYDDDKWNLNNIYENRIGASEGQSAYQAAIIESKNYSYCHIQTKNKFKLGRLDIQFANSPTYTSPPLTNFGMGFGWVDDNSNPLVMHYMTGASGVGVGNVWASESWMQTNTEGIVIHRAGKYDLSRIPYGTIGSPGTYDYWKVVLIGVPAIQRYLKRGTYTWSNDKYDFERGFNDLDGTEGYLRIFNCTGLTFFVLHVSISKTNVNDTVAYIGPEIPTSEYFKSRLVAVYDPLQNWVWTDLNDITGHVYTDETFLAEDIHDFFVTENTSQHSGENVLFVATENGAVIIEENRADHENLKLKYYFRDKDRPVDKYIIYDYTTDFPYFDIHLWSDGTLAKTASEYAGYYSFDYNGRPPANRVIPTIMEPDEENPIAFDIKTYNQTSEMKVFADIFDGGYWTLVMQGFSGSQIDYNDSRWSTASNLAVPNLQSNVAAKYPAFDKIPFSNVYIKAIMGGQDFSLKFSLKNNISMADFFKSGCWSVYTDPDADYDYWITVLREAGVPDAALPPNDPYYYRANVATNYGLVNPNTHLASEVIDVSPTSRVAFPLFCRLGFFGYNPTTNGYVSCGIANACPGTTQWYWYHSGIIYNINDGYETTRNFTSWRLYIQ